MTRLSPFCLGATLLAAVAASAQEDLPPSRVAGVPIPPGRIEAAIAGLEAIVADVMERSGVPGIAVAVVHDGEIVLTQGFGIRRAGEAAPVTPDTVFQLASLSKPVGASVVARQVGKGVVAWDSRMADLLPWFALSDPQVNATLTLGDLYAHRSGLPGHAGDDLEDIGYDRREVLERLRFAPLHSFRDEYAYTNFGLTAAAEAVARAAGTDWADLSRETIYDPLGMDDTSSLFSDFMARDDRAHGHVRRDAEWLPLFQRDPDAQSPAGGVSSSANDMADWMLMVLGEGVWRGDRVVDSDALLAAVSPQVVSGPPGTPDARAGFYGYGFGVGVEPSGRVRLSHSGAFAMGAATNFVLLPSVDLGIVVLTNAAPVGAAEAIAGGFMDLAQFGRVTRDWFAAYEPLFAPFADPVGELVGRSPPDSPEPARPLPYYAGAYGNEYFGPAEVRVAPDGLVLSLGPGPMAFPLRHWSGDVFVYDVTNENAPEGSVSSVTFAVDGAETAGGMRVEILDGDGLGAFLRR